MEQYQNPWPIHPGNLTDHNILLTSEEDIIFQRRGSQYDAPLEYTPTTSETTPTTVAQPLMIPRPNIEPTIHIPHIPLQHNVNKPWSREAHNYSLIDDLAQSLASMSILEVLQTCPTQWKSLLSTLGAVNPTDTRLITFDLDSG
jgi:hypothetical protein